LIWGYRFADVRLCCCFIALTQLDGITRSPAHEVEVGQFFPPMFLFYIDRIPDGLSKLPPIRLNPEATRIRLSIGKLKAAFDREGFIVTGDAFAPAVWSYRSRRCSHNSFSNHAYFYADFGCAYCARLRSGRSGQPILFHPSSI
jgi:hypothetical protein